MYPISDKERLENIKESDIIDAIKALVGKSETYRSHVDETVIIADVYWLIEQAEKVERMEWALNVLKNRTNGWIEFSQFHYIAKQGLGEENCPLDWKK